MDICEKYKLNLLSEGYTKFDRTLEIACYKFCNPNSKKDKYSDLKQFIVLWWVRHKEYMEKYNTQEDLAELMSLKNRGSVSHYINIRTKSKDFDKNVALLKDWLFDVTEKYKMY